jgi:hypothetical protein
MYKVVQCGATKCKQIVALRKCSALRFCSALQHLVARYGAKVALHVLLLGSATVCHRVVLHRFVALLLHAAVGSCKACSATAAVAVPTPAGDPAQDSGGIQWILWEWAWDPAEPHTIGIHSTWEPPAPMDPLPRLSAEPMAGMHSGACGWVSIYIPYHAHHLRTLLLCCGALHPPQ